MYLEKRLKAPLLKLKKLNNKRSKQLLSLLAAAVVFVTTYALILPAITLDLDTVGETLGIVIEQLITINEPQSSDDYIAAMEAALTGDDGTDIDAVPAEAGIAHATVAAETAAGEDTEADARLGGAAADPHTAAELQSAAAAQQTALPAQSVAGGTGVMALSPSALRAGDGDDEETDEYGLPYPTGSKTLEPNDDGTYTLTLSVKGSSNSTVKPPGPKANILFVMDRSSSMITNTVSDEERTWYYGKWNTSDYTYRGDINPDTGYTYYGQLTEDGPLIELTVSNTWSSWYNYNLTYWNGSYYQNYPTDYPVYVRSKTTRMVAEQEALDEVITNLLSNNATDSQDNVEVAVISFGDQRFDYKSWSNETEHSGWVQGTDNSELMTVINSNRFTSGTNWEEALEYANQIISAKKAADGSTEEYYVVFLTDGEPTAVHGESGSAHHTGSGANGNIYAYNAAKDDAQNLVNAGYHFYNIFTFRTDEDETYSIYLTNYAYGNGDYNGDQTTTAVQEYYSDAQTIDQLNDAFSNIFQTVVDTIGHGNVSITDTLTTDAMTTTVVQGKSNGYVYSVTDPSGTELYSVTATGDIADPTVTFTVPGSATKTYTATATDLGNGKTLYSVITDEGDEYRMALADVNETTGKLEWDLSPVGILMDKCTYSVSFVVWPDQGAYDYVAGLNNNLPGYEWDDDAAVLDEERGYWTGGVAEHESIVKYYPDGPYAVLTNKDQQIHYSVLEMTTVNGVPAGEPTVHGPYQDDLELPDPMKLTAASSRMEKQWNVERDPGILAQLLYNQDGTSKELTIQYDILRDDNTLYKTINLGWDADQHKYLWDANSVRTVNYNGHDVEVGTLWGIDFSIATGLMLSGARMDELGMDRNAYPSGTWKGTTYYILEPGHDYTIVEHVDLGYEFDCISPVYHPMLVDGDIQSVNFTGYTEGMTVTEPGDDIEITAMTNAVGGLDSLKVENTLRGYINLEKLVMDKDGKTPLPEDDDRASTRFTYTISLHNSTDPGPFVGESIPWYGVNGLFYHDDDFNYYQAEEAADEPSPYFTLKTASGAVYTAHTTDFSDFDEDIPGPTQITYNDGTRDIVIDLYGNQMDCADANNVSATMEIQQGDVLNLANIPVETTYTITEANEPGFDFVSVRKEIRNGSDVETGATTYGMSVTGEIIPDRDNHITYTNKIHTFDLKVNKVDGNGSPLTGATFTLTKAPTGDETEPTVLIQPGAEDTDTGKYVFYDLPDGDYTLHEDPPAGYTGVGDVTFSVANGLLSGDITLPSGVAWDGDTLTLTVTNTENNNPGEITVRKQWQDYYGNLTAPGADDVNLTLKRTVDTPQTKTLHVVVRVNSNNGYNTVVDQYWSITHDSANVSWYDNSQYSWDSRRISIETSTGLTCESQTPDGGSSTRAIFLLSDLASAAGDPTVTFSYTNANESWIAGQINSFSIVGSGNEVHFSGDPVEDSWSQPITLDADNNWAETITGLPTQDASGNAYHYFIEETAVPGYDVTYSTNNDTGVQSGVLTAYNRRNTVDLTIVKADQKDSSHLLPGASFSLLQIDPEATGDIADRALAGGLTANGVTGEAGTLTFTDLTPGIYEITETDPPPGFMIYGDMVFYVRITEAGAELLQKDEATAAKYWDARTSISLVTFDNTTVTVYNEHGIVLPQSGGIGTLPYRLGGGALIALAVVMYLSGNRRKGERRSSG